MPPDAVHIATALSLRRRRFRHPKRPLPVPFVGKVVAHRGLHVDLPENSLAALAAAADAGYPVEFDVRLTGDGRLVVNHDPFTRNVSERDVWIATSTLEEIQSLRLLHKGVVTEHSIPTLEMVLERINTPIVLELKQEIIPNVGLVKRTCEVLSNFPNIHHRLIVESFNPFVLGRLRQLAPEFHRVQLTGSYHKAPLRRYKRWMLRHLMFNGHSQPDAVALEILLLNPKRIRLLSERFGYSVLAWTAAGAQEVDDLFEAGVACVIADLDDETIKHALQRGYLPN